MKKLIILSAAVALTLSSCGVGAKSLKKEQDSVAYALGMDLGNYIKTVDSTLNVDMIAAGMKDQIAGKPVMSKDTAMNFLREYFTIRKPARDKEEGNKFIEKIEKETKDVKKTPTGLLYQIITPGDAERAKPTDKVRVVYEGTLKDGKVFDSSIARGDTAEFPLNRVIPGWSEGISLIGKGGKIKLWIPSDLAYGEQGARDVISPNQPLVFDVTLVDIIPVDTTAKPMVAPVKPGAVRTAPAAATVK